MVEGTWTYDPSHYPEPMSPLSADVWFWAVGRGIQAAVIELMRLGRRFVVKKEDVERAKGK